MFFDAIVNRKIAMSLMSIKHGCTSSSLQHALKSDKLTLTDLLAKGKRAEVVSVQANTMEDKFEDLSTKLSDINLASKPRQSVRPRTL